MPGPWILVIEDDDLIRDGWVEALTLDGYTATGVASGTDVLQRMPDGTPQLILLDMLMPGMDGFEFLARLRQSPGWNHVPVLIVSGLGEHLAESIDTQGTQTLGVVAILPKPVRLSALLEHVRRTVGPGTPPS